MWLWPCSSLHIPVIGDQNLRKCNKHHSWVLLCVQPRTAGAAYLPPGAGPCQSKGAASVKGLSPKETCRAVGTPRLPNMRDAPWVCVIVTTASWIDLGLRNFMASCAACMSLLSPFRNAGTARLWSRVGSFTKKGYAWLVRAPNTSILSPSSCRTVDSSARRVMIRACLLLPYLSWSAAMLCCVLYGRSFGELSVHVPSNITRAVPAIPGRPNCSELRGNQTGGSNCPILRPSHRTCRDSHVFIVYL